MVTTSHEASHRIFQEKPELLAPIFRLLGADVPEKASVEVLTPEATEIRVLERRVDSVLRVTPCDGPPFLLAIEAQGRRDPDKERSWRYYLGFLESKHRMPALLLVVCRDRATAAWAAGPFACAAQGWTALTVRPMALGPDNVPVITDPEEAARDLTMATFSAMTHGNEPQAPAILEALARALGAVDPTSRDYYAELLEIGLGDSPARTTWRN
ncbi:hypothetical protein ACIQM4_14510, partial [Streptomyces sp. NPDC091272]|uniref:hypothetical protein n=1 Tax=Streptomyces sp. NPDC091272 TaxID=3365981 RepID=UPI0037F2B883